jgi:hypothetical protein
LGPFAIAKPKKHEFKCKELLPSAIRDPIVLGRINFSHVLSVGIKNQLNFQLLLLRRGRDWEIGTRALPREHVVFGTDTSIVPPFRSLS